MDDAFVAENCCRFAEIITNVELRSNPIEGTRDAGCKIDMWLRTGSADSRRVAREVAHFARTKFAAGLWFDVDLERIRDAVGNFTNGCAFPTADIHGQSIELVRFGGEQIRARDVLDKRKVACLFAI